VEQDIQVEVGMVTWTWRRMVKAMQMLGVMRLLRMVRALLMMWMLGTVWANLKMLRRVLQQIWYFGQGP